MKRPTFKIEGKFDAPEADALFATVAGLDMPNGARQCTIDLATVEFMSPAGLTAVAQAAALLKSRGWSPSIRFPDRSDVSHYLARMGFRRAMRGLGRCLGAPRPNRHFRATTALIELTTIRDTGDVDGLLEGLSGNVAGILEEELGYSGGDVGNFRNVISELTRNVGISSEEVMKSMCVRLGLCHLVSSILVLGIMVTGFIGASAAMGAPPPKPVSGPPIHRPAGIPQLTIDDVAMPEGNSGTTAFVFTVTLAPTTSATVTVGYATADGSAQAKNDDYIPKSGALTFDANTSSATISVLVNGDTNVEGDEMFFVNLSNPTNAIMVRSQGIGTIQNDDVAPAPSLAIDDVSHDEGNSGTTPYVFTLSLSSPTDQEVRVRFATADGSATTSDSDYQATSGELTFPANATSATLTVLVNGDTRSEPDETFLVNLSDAVNATLARATGIGTIRNDDEAAPNPNLCHNPSFESNTSGWKRYGNATIKRVSGGQDGRFSLRVSARGEEDGDDDDDDDDGDHRGNSRAEFGVNDSPNCLTLTVATGARYRFTAWVKSSSSKGHVRLRVREYLGDDRQGGATLSPAVTLSSTWKKVTVVRTVRAGGSTLDLQILDQPVRAREVFQVDNISVVLETGLADDQDQEEPLGLEKTDLALSLSPNPIKLAGSLRFVTSRPGPAKIELFDVSGRRLRSVLDASFLPGGPHEISIETRSNDGVRLSAGMYFYRVQTVDGTVSRRFTILE